MQGYQDKKYNDDFYEYPYLISNKIVMFQGEIKKAINGKEFFYFTDTDDTIEEEKVLCMPVDFDEFNTCLRMWKMAHYFNAFPNSSNYNNELSWIIDICLLFEDTYHEISNFMQEKSLEESKKKYGKN